MEDNAQKSISPLLPIEASPRRRRLYSSPTRYFTEKNPLFDGIHAHLDAPFSEYRYSSRRKGSERKRRSEHVGNESSRRRSSEGSGAWWNRLSNGGRTAWARHLEPHTDKAAIRHEAKADAREDAISSPPPPPSPPPQHTQQQPPLSASRLSLPASPVPTSQPPSQSHSQSSPSASRRPSRFSLPALSPPAASSSRPPAPAPATAPGRASLPLPLPILLRQAHAQALAEAKSAEGEGGGEGGGGGGSDDGVLPAALLMTPPGTGRGRMRSRERSPARWRRATLPLSASSPADPDPAPAGSPSPSPSSSIRRQQASSGSGSSGSKGGRARATRRRASLESEGGPDVLSHQDIPALLERANCDRKELFSLFARFKALCALSGSGGGRGMDESTLKRVSRLSVEDELFVSRVFRLLDEDGSGYIEWEEFLDAMAALGNGPLHKRALFLFQVYDVDEDGVISRADMATMFRSSSFLGKDDTSDLVVDTFVNRVFATFDGIKRERIQQEKEQKEQEQRGKEKEKERERQETDAEQADAREGKAVAEDLPAAAEGAGAGAGAGAGRFEVAGDARSRSPQPLGPQARAGRPAEEGITYADLLAYIDRAEDKSKVDLWALFGRTHVPGGL